MTHQDEEYGDWLYHKRQDEHLDLLGIIPRQAPPPEPPKAACYAPPQWKPSYPGEQPPF